MMAHVAPPDYAVHGQEAPPYNVVSDNYAGDYLSPQVPGDPMSFHRPQRQLSEDALADALAGIRLAQSAPGRPGLHHNNELVVHAIEAAATAIKDQASALRDQISENDMLRSALRVREWELQNSRIDQGQTSNHPENQSHDEYALQQAATSNQPLIGKELWPGNGFSGDLQNSLIVHPSVQSLAENYYRFPFNGAPSQQFGSNFGANGVVRNKNLPDGTFSHTSSPTARSLSPIRHGIEGESGARGVLPPGAVGRLHPPQELVKSTLRPQDEIKHLKKILSDCSLKEMQLVHEKHMLEKRLSELRMTIETYQQKLVDAASRETFHLEESARLESEIRAAAQDVSFYATSLMPLLADYNLRPATPDPHSIVSGIKALVQHLREEARKDSGTPKKQWHNPQGYPQSPRGVSSSPVHPSWPRESSETNGLQLVPQSAYLQPERPLSPTSPLSHNPIDWEANLHHPFGAENYRNENVRHQVSETAPVNSHRIPPDYGNPALQRRIEPYNDVEDESNLTGIAYGATDYADRAEQISSKLSTVGEEPSSFLSDEDDPSPGIEGLSINGDAELGNKITACGLSIHGTTLCHFQWVRHHQDGSSFHIPGASQPEYTITADDVDTMLSLECTPMDDRNRKGRMVQVFVNNCNRITIDKDMTEGILKSLDSGQAIFEVKLVIENSQESSTPAILYLKRSWYELKRTQSKKVVGSDRYGSESAVEIKVGKDSECAILNNTSMYLLHCNDNRTRDMLVLTMRQFMKAAGERKRGKKKGLFSK